MINMIALVIQFDYLQLYPIFKIIYKLLMSDDENYEQSEVKGEDEMKFRTEEKLQLHKVIQTILGECQKSQPMFPPLLSKKVCESNGLECTEDTFFNLMSNVVEYSLNEIINSNKDIKHSGKYKKDGNQTQLKTIQVQKYFQAKGVHIAKPRCFPEIALENSSQQKDSMKE